MGGMFVGMLLPAVASAQSGQADCVCGAWWGRVAEGYQSATMGFGPSGGREFVAVVRPFAAGDEACGAQNVWNEPLESHYTNLWRDRLNSAGIPWVEAYCAYVPYHSRSASADAVFRDWATPIELTTDHGKSSFMQRVTIYTLN